MTVQRKGVLLRLAPDVLERVDRARGAMNRTEWLVLAVMSYLTHWDATGERPSGAQHAGFMDRSERKLTANMGAVGHRFPDQYDKTFDQGAAAPGDAAVAPVGRQESQSPGSNPGSPTPSTSSSEQGVPSARGRLDDGEPEGLGYDGASGDAPTGSPIPYDPAAW